MEAASTEGSLGQLGQGGTGKWLLLPVELTVPLSMPFRQQLGLSDRRTCLSLLNCQGTTLFPRPVQTGQTH